MSWRTRQRVLRLPAGGAASPCLPVGAAPMVYAETQRGRTVAFGTAPASTASVRTARTQAVLVTPSAEVVRRARLPAGVRYYVVAVSRVPVPKSELRFECRGRPCGG